MKTFRTEVSIDASQEHVWSVLTDFGKYPSWNPFIRKIIGHPGPNGELRITVKLPYLPPVAFNARIADLVTGERIGWHAVFLKGLLCARHWFELHKTDSGRTMVIHCEEFTGLFSGTVPAILSGAFGKGYRLMNIALRTESERKG